jgi:DNA-binding transcriptional LysR family regulator
MNDQIELRHLRYFVAVARELHFGKAAKKLHIAQPPLSQQIRRLEGIVGVTLFQRTSRSVTLTPAGVALLRIAGHTLTRIQHGLDEVRRIAAGEVGSLSVGFVSSAIFTQMPGLLKEYRARHPMVRLDLHELHTSQLLSAIRDGEIDVGFVRDPEPTANLLSRPVLTEPLVVMFSKNHPLASYRLVPLEKLEREPFVFYPRSAGEYAWEKVMKLCKTRGFRPSIVQEAPHWHTIVGLVAAGFGVTIAPECVKKAMDDQVEYRPLRPRGLTEVHLAWNESSSNPAVVTFCSEAQKAFSSSPVADE